MSRPLACLVGGAGTGKTFTCKLICGPVDPLRWRRAPCAPSPARRRCGCPVRPAVWRKPCPGHWRSSPSATTSKPFSSTKNASEDEKQKAKLKLDGLSRITDSTLVVVDEASMVDLPTFDKLAKRLRPGSRLLLVGDEAQLPPIGFGLVFHKLVGDPSITSRLTQVHRQAAATGIPAAASAIRTGGLPDFSPLPVRPTASRSST
ncbi:AAA family ATPase [Bradyrhizobium betae]|uniref:AAA family ATPase n=1 Tax=Bradyrhizobium betae TaxID=244734 RepID=UPI003D66B2B6